MDGQKQKQKKMWAETEQTDPIDIILEGKDKMKRVVRTAEELQDSFRDLLDVAHQNPGSVYIKYKLLNLRHASTRAVLEVDSVYAANQAAIDACGTASDVHRAMTVAKVPHALKALQVEWESVNDAIKTNKSHTVWNKLRLKHITDKRNKSRLKRITDKMLQHNQKMKDLLVDIIPHSKTNIYTSEALVAYIADVRKYERLNPYVPMPMGEQFDIDFYIRVWQHLSVLEAAVTPYIGL